MSDEFLQMMELRSYPNCHNPMWGIYSRDSNGKIYRLSMSSTEMHSMIKEYETQEKLIGLLQSQEYHQIDYLDEDPLLDMLNEKVRKIVNN